MRRVLALFALAALVACGQGATTTTTTASTTTTTTVNAAPGLQLTCATFEHMTRAALASAYGASNITEQTLDGAEGEQYTATVVFSDDPARRMELLWHDGTPEATPDSVSIAGAHSSWTGPHGVVLGQSLPDVERINGHPFKLYGFDWDYGGMVSDWSGGALATDGDCGVHMQMNETASNYSGAIGDSEFMSNSPAMRGANAVVSMVSLSMPGGEPLQPDK